MSKSPAMDPGYDFTDSQDWFSGNIDVWRALFKRVEAPQPRALEIGSWEGRSAVFLLTELCRTGGEIVCIDHFDLMRTAAGRERHRKLTHNLSLTGKPFRIVDEFSVPGLMTLLKEEMAVATPGFDWLYIDGSHEADDTFLDGELAWRLARKGAIMIFDDYRWDREPEDSIHHPKRGIDAFLTLHVGEFTLLSSNTQYQLVLQKTVDMRIGFLVKELALDGDKLEDALGYGINVALTIDSEYAIAAAVAIRSAATHTRGRITFYVVGDLSGEVKTKLRQSIEHNANATLVFVDLLRVTLDASCPAGLTWAKISMIPSLPVERVIYLDADTLVRRDLKELWDTDLEGKPLAAAPDVGLPMGHGSSELSSKPYFNAGVMLMNLASIRNSQFPLFATAARMKESTHKDQDALNAHFQGNWRPLSLKWNAQGLGTYVRYHTPERAALDLKDMDDPAIVHFTGALHPSLAEVINPFVQPYGGKPWGYAGAPGHPFTEEWWRTCEETAWREWRSSEEFREQCARTKESTIAAGIEAFQQKLGDVEPSLT